MYSPDIHGEIARERQRELLELAGVLHRAGGRPRRRRPVLAARLRPVALRLSGTPAPVRSPQGC